MTALDTIKENNYRIGDCQAIRYDRNNTALFSPGYLGHLYGLCSMSGRRNDKSFLDAVFGNNPMSHFDAIVPFLASRPLIILGIWEGDKFHEAGFAFPAIFCGTAQTEASAFCGYGMLKHVWGTPEEDTLAILGLAMLFCELNLVAIHGTRFVENTLTARFMSRFGFRDIGTLPHYQLKDGKLVPTVLSTLSREEFEKFVETHVVMEDSDGSEDSNISAEDGGQIAQSAVQETGTQRQNVATYQTGKEAALKVLIAGDVKAVWFPVGTREIPQLPTGMESTIVDGGFEGDGIWMFNPRLLSDFDIWVAAGNGKHSELLEPVRVGREIKMMHFSEVGYWPKDDVAPAPTPQAPTNVIPAPTKRITIQAFRDGVFAGESTIPATAEAIENIQRAFEGCELRVKQDDVEEKPGVKGGKARAAKMTKEERSENARRAAEARWKK